MAYGDVIAAAGAVIAATGAPMHAPKADVRTNVYEICYENNFIILHTLSYVSCVFQ